MSLILIPNSSDSDNKYANLEAQAAYNLLEDRINRAEIELQEINKHQKEIRRLIIGGCITIVSSILAVLIKISINA